MMAEWIDEWSYDEPIDEVDHIDIMHYDFKPRYHPPVDLAVVHSFDSHTYTQGSYGENVTLSVGDKINHNILGSGTITSFIGTDGVIKFKNGEKRIDLKRCLDRALVQIG